MSLREKLSRIGKELHSLNWSITYSNKGVILKKRSKETGLKAKVNVKEEDSMFIIESDIYKSSKEHIENQLKIFYNGGRAKRHLEGKAHRYLERMIFGHIEAYLSGATNIKKIREHYKKHKRLHPIEKHCCAYDK